MTDMGRENQRYFFKHFQISFLYCKANILFFLQNSSSYTNDKEVAITRSNVIRLNEQGIDLSTVVIISMYEMHVSFLRKMLADLGEIYAVSRCKFLSCKKK